MQILKNIFKNKTEFLVTNKETGFVVDKFKSLEDAHACLEEIEKDEKQAGIFQPDCYIIKIVNKTN